MKFVKKFEIFLFFYLRQHKPGKCVVRYSTEVKCVSRLKKQELNKVEKLAFFLKGLVHGFG